MKTILLKISLPFFLALTSSAWAGIDPVYLDIYHQVNQSNLVAKLKDMSGVNPVTVAGETFTISNRYLPAGKENFRKYWTAYYQSLGMQVNALNYKTQYNIETEGHNLEAILPGKSTDSVVILVHYDSIGPHGADNPGVDDDMTGMAIQLETARILAARKGLLQNTVRFVAVDYEEWGSLEGSRTYAKYIGALAKSQNFKIVSAIDDEQSGWNCAREGKCKDGSTAPELVVDDCSTDGQFNDVSFGTLLKNLSSDLGGIPVVLECSGEDSDHYAMWEAGYTALEFGEYSWERNDHFDQNGGDFFEKIDTDYFFSIAQIGVVFAATQIGLTQ
jgi:hypothetical protein